MAYEPYTWNPNEVLSSDKLNHIETGIADLDNKSVHIYGEEKIEGFKTFTNGSEFISGSYGLRVTSEGIQRTSDGGKNWINI